MFQFYFHPRWSRSLAAFLPHSLTLSLATGDQMKRDFNVLQMCALSHSVMGTFLSPRRPVFFFFFRQMHTNTFMLHMLHLASGVSVCDHTG